MASLLLSGPAGGGKSALAAGELQERAGGPPTIIVDFQLIYATLAGAVRGPDGTFPLRDPALLPVTEYVRRAAITGAVQRGIDVVATNSDGDTSRRQQLLALLGAGAVERIIDPGRTVVQQRLAEPTGALSPECTSAINRWYDRL